MGKPTSRVLALLELLQAGGVLTGVQVAERLGVDRRTVRRYVAHLVELGVPVQAERGRDGGYRLRPGYKLPPMMFSADEALALAVGLRAAGELGLAGITPAVASTQAKLERVLPATLRRRLSDIAETVSLDMTRPFAAGTTAALLGLSAAARAQQRVRLRYRGRDGDETARDVDVYGLAWRGGSWYAVGHCHLRRDLRSFRLDRVQDVEALPASFGRPPGFDVLGHLVRSIALLPRAHAVEVRLETDLAQARRAVFVELGELVDAGNKGVLLRGQADDLDWFARELARLPFALRIVKPAALRRALVTHASALIDRAG
ncbi:MAG: YafY family transcriptional regulator [Proteobacteria bacterium]|nr:YafY family transcriptional regulator [Pseudomonadota bacterium]